MRLPPLPVTQVPGTCRVPQRERVPRPLASGSAHHRRGEGLTEPTQPVPPETSLAQTEQNSTELPALFCERKRRWVCLKYSHYSQLTFMFPK